MAVKKICVLTLGKAGVLLSAVIAFKCPEIRVTVVKTNAEDVCQWCTGKIPQSVPGLMEFIRKCQNKNLVFTTNEVHAIKEADIIFILSESRLKSHGEGRNQVMDLSMIEEAAYLIAEHAESSKIVVDNSSVPLKSAACISNAFKRHTKPDVQFQVLSNPEFYEDGSPLRYLLFPDCVLIGSENTPEGLAAAKQLASIYERWVPSEYIITRTNWTVELSKISTSAMVAHTLASIYTIFHICEQSGGDAASVVDMISKNNSTPPGDLDFCSNAEKYPMVLHNLIYMCEFLDLYEVADYWRQVLEMFTVHQDRFFKKFIWTLTHIWNKRIALLGLSYYKDTQVTEGWAAIDLCKRLLEENSVISIYDPRVTKGQVIEALKSAGCNAPDESLEKSVLVYNDPYKALAQSHAIITWCPWPEFAKLDYSRIYGEMVKPAYIFNRGLTELPHSKLCKIGFKVYADNKKRKLVRGLRN